MTPPAAAASSVQRGAKLAPPRPRPRRVSGPVKPLPRSRPGARPATAPRDGLILGLLGAVETVSSHRLLDRLIRGRAWIGLLAFALIGIVTLQLTLLKLNSGIGRAIERSAKLQTENAALSIENSELSSGDRIESQAERLGMKLVAIDGLHFLASHARGDVAHAAAALREPVHPPSEAPAEEASSRGSSEESSATGEAEATEAETAASETSSSSVETPSTSTSEPTSSSAEPETPTPAPVGESTASTAAGGGTASPAG
jgi:cell division protein FtsL